MSEDSNQPTPPPSPEERPAQPEASSFLGDSWLLDVGPDPGVEFVEHEAVPALPMDWAANSQGEAPEAVPAHERTAPAPAQGFDVFDETQSHGEMPEGYEAFGDGGEAS
ncbi:MAG: hypothetical protein P8M11_04750, partial [Planctomycetota bacterium]|nr:hypothetical protein [Planctomycetota bacterium]